MSLPPTSPVIPSIQPRTVMLDTCVLSEVVTRPNLREWFAQWLETGNLVCYISILSLHELIGGVDGQGGIKDHEVLKRVKGLRALSLQAGRRLRESADFVDNVLAELHQHQRLVHPLESDSDQSTFEQMIQFQDTEASKFILWALDAARYIKLKKDKLYSLDRSIREESKRFAQESPDRNKRLAQEFSAENVLQKINGREIEYPLSEIIASQLLNNKTTSEQIIKRISSYQILNCAEQLVWRSYLANGAPAEASQREIVLFRTKKKGGRGDWYDHYVAATSAACTMFITEDNRLFDRCKHIQSLGVSAINAYKAENVIDGYVETTS